MSTDESTWRPRNSRLGPAFELWRSGDLERALEAMIAAAESYPDDPDAWRGLGSVYWSGGQFHAALRAFQTALTIEYWSPVHWATVGLALRDLGRREGAAHALITATLIDPGYAPAWNELANVLVDSGRPNDALPLYARVLTIDSSRAVYFHNRGVALRMIGNCAEARRSFTAALELDAGYQWSIAELRRLNPSC